VGSSRKLANTGQGRRRLNARAALCKLTSSAQDTQERSDSPSALSENGSSQGRASKQAQPQQQEGQPKPMQAVEPRRFPAHNTEVASLQGRLAR
jgi:hypothetical protein